MNILIDIRSLLDKPYTGVAQYSLNFLNGTLERDKENKYFLFYNSAKIKNSDLPQFDYPNVKIVDFHWPNKLFNLCLWLLKWPKIDKLVGQRIGKKIDEIFLPNFNFIAFSKKIKTTLVAHDLSFEIYPHFFTFKQRLWHILIDPKKLCQKVDKIITHAQNTKNDLINFYQISEKKIEVKKPPINQAIKKIDLGEHIIQNTKNKYQLPDNFLLYLGNLEPRKNLDTLIRAFHELLIHNSSFISHLIIAGVGKERKKLEKLVQKLEIGDRVKFLSYVSEQEKVVLYNLAKIFIYPSFYEGYGYPVAEAINCGLPVITSHTSSLTEINGENIIFINPHDINDLVEAINFFY